MRRWLENEGNVRVKCQDFCVYTHTHECVKWVGLCVCTLQEFGIEQRERNNLWSEIRRRRWWGGLEKMLFSSSLSRGSNDFCRHDREKGVCVTLQLSAALYYIICAAAAAALWTRGLDIIVGSGFFLFLLSRSRQAPGIQLYMYANPVRFFISIFFF